MPVNTLNDTSALMSCMAKRFFNALPIKPKLIPCDRYIAGMGSETLKPEGKCFIQLQIGKKGIQGSWSLKTWGISTYYSKYNTVLGTQPQVNIISP